MSNSSMRTFNTLYKDSFVLNDILLIILLSFVGTPFPFFFNILKLLNRVIVASRPSIINQTIEKKDETSEKTLNYHDS